MSASALEQGTVIRLNPKQFEVQSNKTAREVYYEGGNGSGKTFELAEWTLDRSASNPPECMGMVVTLTSPMMDTIIVPEMTAAFRRWGTIPRFYPSKGLYVWGPQNRRIWLRTSKEPERLEGPTLAFTAMDEAGQSKPAAYARIATRTRDKHARVIQRLFIGRPEGNSTWFSKHIKEILRGQRRSKYAIHVRGTTFDNPHNDDGYIDDLLNITSGDPAAERRIIHGEDAEDVGNIFGVISDENIVEMHDPARGHIVMGCDFNIDHMVWIVGTWFPNKGVLHIWGEFISLSPEKMTSDHGGHPSVRRVGFDGAMTNEHAAMVAQALVRKRVCSRERAGLIDATNQMVTCYPDASGKNRDTGAEMSDHALMRAAGFAIRSDPGNPSVRDSTSVVRYALRKHKLLVCPKGAPLVLQSLRTHGRDRHGDPQKAPDFPVGELEVDHYTDCVRYLTWGVMPLRRKAGLVPVR